MDTVQNHTQADTGKAGADASIKPKLTTSAEGFYKALEMLDIAFRLNVRADRIEGRIPTEKPDLFNDGWRLLDDYSEARIKVDVETAFDNLSKESTGWRVSNPRWDTYVKDYAGQYAVDPFIENYLNSHPVMTIPVKNTKLLDNWLNDLFDWDADPELVTWASRNCFLGAVQRAYEPGCKLDETLVMIGPQEGGKSSLVQSIIPPAKQREWFTDAIDLSATDKVLAEATAGRVICELGEMAGITKKELSKIKQWLSRQDDGGTRKVWVKHANENLRRFICIGTANGDCLPNDNTGNRRFVAIETHDKRAKVKPETYLDKHRNELFAQAHKLYQDGERANMPYELREKQDSNNDQYRANDEYTEDIVRLKLDAAEYAPGERFKLSEFVDDLNRERPTGAPAISPFAVKKALQMSGCENKRTTKGRFWMQAGNDG